jgi:putative tryptophan/tyrosine transport system substrate-binding protein
MIRRREFIMLLGGAAAVAVGSTCAAAGRDAAHRRAPTRIPGRFRFSGRVETFVKELARLGWTIGRNIQIDIRWASTNANEIRRHAGELAALSPDVILATGDSTMPPLLQATRTIPIVFPVGMDPVANGYIDSLARPGGNATGFMDFEYSVSGKWLELLKEIAPSVKRVAVLRDTTANVTGLAQLGVIQAIAPALRVEVNPVNLRDADEIERASWLSRTLQMAV